MYCKIRSSSEQKVFHWRNIVSQKGHPSLDCKHRYSNFCCIFWKTTWRVHKIDMNMIRVQHFCRYSIKIVLKEMLFKNIFGQFSKYPEKGLVLRIIKSSTNRNIWKSCMESQLSFSTQLIFLDKLNLFILGGIFSYKSIYDL